MSDRDDYGFDHGASIAAILGSDDDDDGDAFVTNDVAVSDGGAKDTAPPTACKRPREGDAVAVGGDGDEGDDDVVAVEEHGGTGASVPVEALLAPPDAPRRRRGRKSKADKAAESLRNAFTVLQCVHSPAQQLRMSHECLFVCVHEQGDQHAAVVAGRDAARQRGGEPGLSLIHI